MPEPKLPPLGVYNNGDHTEQDWAVQGAREHMLTEAQAAEVLRRNSACEEAEAVACALLGAMPPALQRKWPNIVKRAMAIHKDREARAAIAKGRV